MSTEAQLKALSNSELASGTQIPALKHRTVNDAIIEEMYDAQSRGNVLSGVQSATSLASGDEVFVIRSGEAYLLDADELGFVSTLADLTDVNIPSPSNDQVLAYNFGTSKWVSKDVSSLSSVVSITGTATTNQMVKFTGLSSIGNSIVSDNGTTVNIGGNLSVDNNLTVGTINSGTATDFVKGDGSLDGTTYQDEAEKNQANGYAPLDSGAKIPLANLPDSILGQVSYQGTWAASSNTPTLANPPASTTKGEYYVASDDGTQFGIEFKTGDWIISNGTAWEKVDNTDAVTSVFGRLGNIIALQEDYDDFYVTLNTEQDITGQKTFDNNTLRLEDAGNGLVTVLGNINSNTSTDSGLARLGFNATNNIFFSKGTSVNMNAGVLAFNNTDPRTYTLPDASGTFAFTSDLDDYVTLDTAQTINGFKTFTNIQIDGSAGLRLIKQIGVNLPAENITTLVGIEDNLALVVGLGSSNFKSVTFSTSLLTNNVDRLLEIPDASGTLALTSDLNTLNASNITTGTLSDARLSSNVALKDVDNNFSVGQTINGQTTINDDFLFVSTASAGDLRIGEVNSQVGLYTDGDLRLRGDSEVRLTVSNSNNVIVTSSLIELNRATTINGQLDVKSTNSIIRVTNTTGGLSNSDLDLSVTNTGLARIWQYGLYDMVFATNNTERMRIDNSGNVGIKKTDPVVELDVDGEIRASNGILFGTDTAAANALDDYEEGTFTLYLNGYSGVTFSANIGHYTKIGRLVQVSFLLTISNVGTFTSNSFIGGFPFATGTTETPVTGGQLNLMTAYTAARADQYVAFFNGTSNLFIYTSSGTAQNGNNFQAGTLSGTLTYFTA